MLEQNWCPDARHCKILYLAEPPAFKLKNVLVAIKVVKNRPGHIVD
jgi:hypothetical protein